MREFPWPSERWQYFANALDMRTLPQVDSAQLAQATHVAWAGCWEDLESLFTKVLHTLQIEMAVCRVRTASLNHYE